MSIKETMTSPFSDEHYKALASVADRLTEIINRPNSSEYVRTRSIDSLAEIVGILGTVKMEKQSP